jgi:DUF1680 family protein
VTTRAVRTDRTGGALVAPSRGRWKPLGVADVALADGFWGALQATNASATLDHCEQWMEREGWLANFDRVALGQTTGERPGWSFADSEVYKLLEALAWEFGRTGDAAVEDTVRRLTARVASAMDPDGYLNTCFGHVGQRARYSDLELGHELYCTGHLLQAAVARMRTVGEDELVDLARRAADHVCDTFGPSGLKGLCGHPEIEVGLVEFGRAVSEPRYVLQAALFVERRGRGLLKDIPPGSAYFQDDVPVREATVWRGHAVRALYLSAGAVDVAVEQDDDDLLAAIERQWTATVSRRTYITGGMGSRHQDEGFGEDWELPPDRAYCETCAGVASVMVSWRLFLATGDVRYADLIERTFYNVVATSPRGDGRAFFYANPLQQRVAGPPANDDVVSPRAESGTRAAWFDVSCCPTNIARTLATWQAHSAAVSEDDLVLLQYANGRLRATLGRGDEIELEIVTAYPDDGIVTVQVIAAPTDAWGLQLRVPDWAAGAVLDDGVHRREVPPGLVTVNRSVVPGDVVRLELPMRPRVTVPDDRIDATRGCVAYERGPLVLCAESTDLPAGVSLERVRADLSVPPDVRDGDVWIRTRIADPQPDGLWPYGATTRPGTSTSDEMVLRPYHSWAERGPSTMRVWLPGGAAD